MVVGMDIKFTGEQVGFITGNNCRHDCNGAWCRFVPQGSLIDAILGLDGDFHAANFQIDSGVLDWASIGESIEIDRQLLSIYDADQFIQF